MESIRKTKRVRALVPPAPYIGGKRNLALRLVKMIAATRHTTYAEPFVGMGGIFFRRELAAKSEVINDFSGDVANFFRILQRHYPQFMEMLKFQITSRTAFERLVKTDPDTLTDLERAARFIYLQRLAFGGKVAGRNFGVSLDRPARFNVNMLAPQLEELHERLAGVVIERLDFEAFLEKYDRATTLFYLDPPYHGSEGYYGPGMFSRSDFDRLAAALARLKGRFILSINDTPDIRETFSAFAQKAVKTSYTAGSGSKVARELIITN